MEDDIKKVEADKVNDVEVDEVISKPVAKGKKPVTKKVIDISTPKEPAVNNNEMPAESTAQTNPETIESSVAESVKTPKKGKSRWFALSVIVVVLLVLVGGGAGAYIGYIKPNQPKAVVKKALSNVLAFNRQRSFNVTVEITNKTTSDSNLKLNNLSIAGGVDSNSNVRADVVVDTGDFNIDASAIVRLDDQKLYLKFSNLERMFSAIPNAMDYPEVANFVNALSDNWIRLSVSDLQDAGMLTSAQANKASDCIDAATSFIKNSSGTFQSQFNNLYDKADFATMSKVGSEIVDGKSMTKYAVSINQTRFKNFMRGLGNQLSGATRNIADKCGIDNAISSTDSSSNSSSSNVQLQSVFLWIDSSKQIGQVEITLGDDSMDVVLTATLGTKSVDTSAPSHYSTISDLLQDPTFTQMLQSMF